MFSNCLFKEIFALRLRSETAPPSISPNYLVIYGLLGAGKKYSSGHKHDIGMRMRYKSNSIRSIVKCFLVDFCAGAEFNVQLIFGLLDPSKIWTRAPFEIPMGGKAILLGKLFKASNMYAHARLRFKCASGVSIYNL